MSGIVEDVYTRFIRKEVDQGVPGERAKMRDHFHLVRVKRRTQVIRQGLALLATARGVTRWIGHDQEAHRRSHLPPGRKDALLRKHLPPDVEPFAQQMVPHPQQFPRDRHDLFSQP
jgi:hypothetical protein